MHAFADKKVTVGVPVLAAIILGIVGAVLQVLNYSVISAGSQLHASIAVALLFLTGIGIPPLTGAAFKAALHLPAWVYYIVGAVMSAALLALTTIHMASAAHEWIAAGLTLLSAWGFSASVTPVPTVAAKR